MDFDIGDRTRALCERIRELFLSDSRFDLDHLETDTPEPFRHALIHYIKGLAGIGYLDLGLENGQNSVELVAAQETLAAVSPPLFLAVEVSARIFGRLLVSYRTSDQQYRILSGLREGHAIGAVALVEKGMSTGHQAFSTQAVNEGGVFYVTGEKNYVVNGPIADWIAVAAQLEGKSDTACFLISRENEGLSVGSKLATLGYRGTPMGSIVLKDCPVPADFALVPCKGNGILSMLRLWEGQVLTAAALGQMKRVFDIASDYAKNHMSAGKPIIAYQEVAFKLAEMMTLFQTAQLMAYRAAWMDDTDHKDKGVLAHCAKVFCTESAETLASQSLQILGAKGYLEGNPAETGYRDAKYLQIAGTSSEIARMKIADALLGGA